MNRLEQPLCGVIFDYGGTLDTNGVHWSCLFYAAYQSVGVEIAPPHFMQAYIAVERQLEAVGQLDSGLKLYELLRLKVKLQMQHLIYGDMQPASLLNLADRVTQYCCDYLFEQVEGSRLVLMELLGSYRLALVTNYYGNIATILGELGIATYFDVVVESAVVGVRKPNPQIFQLAIEALHATPAHILVVGDSVANDIEPAQSLGCQTVWLHPVQGDGDALPPHTPTLTIGNIRELLDILL